MSRSASATFEKSQAEFPETTQLKRTFESSHGVRAITPTCYLSATS
jgi:hypothetical protein